MGESPNQLNLHIRSSNVCWARTKGTRGELCKNKLVSTSALPPEPSELTGSPELLSLPCSRRCPHPQDGGSLPPSKCCYGSASPQHPQRAIQVHSGGARPSPELLQAGETESGGEVPGAGWGAEVRGGKPSPQAPGGSRRSRGAPPARPALRGEAAGGAGSAGGGGAGPGEAAGPQFFTEEAEGARRAAAGGGGSCQA